MSDTAILIERVGKTYRIWDNPSARVTSPLQAGLANVLPPPLGNALRRRAAKAYRDFDAIRDISFEIMRGESVGIIGRNGSGKSTLLQIIAGTLQPTAGLVQVNGQVAALLELGSGFNHEFTGRENVYLNGTVLGLSRAEVDAKFDEIAAFAEIGDFMEQPIKTYSSGMMVRLAFSVQTAIEPDILIVDEALSVGDFFFQQKCFKRLAALRDRGTTLLFVSHDTASVRNLCSRTLLLKQGRQVYFGESQHAISLYFQDQGESEVPRIAPTEIRSNPSDLLLKVRATALWTPAEKDKAARASLPAEIAALTLLDEQGAASTSFTMGQHLTVQVLVQSHQDITLHCSVEFKNRHGQVIACIGNFQSNQPPVPSSAGQLLCFKAKVYLGLEAGEYSLQTVLGLPGRGANSATRLDATPWVGPFSIGWDYESKPAPFLGMFHLPAIVKFTVAGTADSESALPNPERNEVQFTGSQ
jgi:lipopolysaccharide transport system ATP-binding protein